MATVTSSSSTATNQVIQHLLWPRKPPLSKPGLFSLFLRSLSTTCLPTSSSLLLRHYRSTLYSPSSSRLSCGASPLLSLSLSYSLSTTSLSSPPKASLDHRSLCCEQEEEEDEETDGDFGGEVADVFLEEEEDEEIEEVELGLEENVKSEDGPLKEEVGLRRSGLKLPTLTVKEKKELASYAHGLGKKLKCQLVGKSGVTSNVATSFMETLEANELLKIKIHRTCPGELDEVVQQLQEATGSVVVGQIGRTVIIYRPSLTKLKAEEKKLQARSRTNVRKDSQPKPTLLSRVRVPTLSKPGRRRRIGV